MAAMFDMAHKGNNYFGLLDQWDLVRNWCNRIAKLPDFVIESIVNRIPEMPRPNSAERQRLCEFLLNRRRYLFDHVVRWQNQFPGLPTFVE